MDHLAKHPLVQDAGERIIGIMTAVHQNQIKLYWIPNFVLGQVMREMV
jgi:hypothetical protein